MEGTSEEKWLTEFAKLSPTQSHSLYTFKKIVGVHPHVVERLWCTYLKDHHFQLRDLLWTLSFLSCYCCNDVVMAAVWGVSETHYMSQVWLVLEHLYMHLDEVSCFFFIVNVSQVSLSTRFGYFYPKDGPFTDCCLVVDTSECPIQNNLAATYSGYKKKNTMKYEGK